MIPSNSLLSTSPSIKTVENSVSFTTHCEGVILHHQDSSNTTAKICISSTCCQEGDTLGRQEAILAPLTNTMDVDGDEESLGEEAGDHHHDRAAVTSDYAAAGPILTSRIAGARGLNAVVAADQSAATGALPAYSLSSSGDNMMEAPTRNEASRCAFHPSSALFAHRPARGDGPRSRSDSLVVHVESEDDKEEPLYKMVRQVLPSPTHSASTATSGSSNLSNQLPHPKFAQLQPGGLRDNPRPPETRHRRFANQLKRKLRELESSSCTAEAHEPNGDSRIELAPKDPPTSLHHASNQAYDADTEDEGESLPSADHSSEKKLAYADHKHHGDDDESGRGVAKRHRSSTPSPRVDKLMPDAISKNSETP